MFVGFGARRRLDLPLEMKIDPLLGSHLTMHDLLEDALDRRLGRRPSTNQMRHMGDSFVSILRFVTRSVNPN